jgi:hypothetical protein
MRGIKVDVQRPTEAGRLYPRYDKEADILVLASRRAREWIYGVDVDGRIVFDLDRDRVLANCDLHIPMNRWARDLEIEWPAGTRLGDVAFSKDTVAHKSFHLPLEVRSDPSGQYIRIEIGETLPDEFIALSDCCIALLALGELVGLLVRDSPIDPPDRNLR